MHDNIVDVRELQMWGSPGLLAMSVYKLPIFTQISLWPGEWTACLILWSHPRHLVPLIGFPKQVPHQVSPALYHTGSLNTTPPLRDCQPRVFNRAPACDSFGVRVIVNTPPDSQYAIRATLIVCSFIQGVQRLNLISKFLAKEAMICFSTKIGLNGSQIDVLFCTAFAWFTS